MALRDLLDRSLDIHIEGSVQKMYSDERKCGDDKIIAERIMTQQVLYFLKKGFSLCLKMLNRFS